MLRLRALTLGRTVRLLFFGIKSNDHRRNRLLGIVQGTVTGLGSKIVGILVSLLSVPLTIGYLGTERYGAWITLGSLLAWLSLSDFGIGNGLTNAITTAAGQDRPDLVRMHVSNGVFLLSGLALAVALAAALAWPFINWSALLGLASQRARNEIGPAVAAALVMFLMQFPLAVSSKVFMAYREGRIANYFSAAGNILGLLALLIVTHTRGGLVWLVIAVYGTGMCVNCLASAWLFLRHKPLLSPHPRHIKIESMHLIARTGGQFFLIGIMALVTFQTDNLVISHFLGAACVPEYSLTYRLFNYTTLPQSMLFGYLWTAYNEAIARKDIAWVAKVFRTSLVVGTLFTAVAVVGVAYIAKPFIGWWGGHNVVPSSALVFWMAGWDVILSFTNPIACLLAAASHLRVQLFYASFSTVLNLFLSIYLVHRWGVQGVIAATVIAYGIFVCIPVYIDAELLLRRLQRAA